MQYAAFRYGLEVERMTRSIWALLCAHGYLFASSRLRYLTTLGASYDQSSFAGLLQQEDVCIAQGAVFRSLKHAEASDKASALGGLEATWAAVTFACTAWLQM